jgi:hypothetical protein
MRKLDIEKFANKHKLKKIGKEDESFGGFWGWEGVKLIRRINGDKIIVEFKNKFYYVNYEDGKFNNSDSWLGRIGIFKNKFYYVNYEDGKFNNSDSWLGRIGISFVPADRKEEIYLLNKKEAFFYKMKY